MKTFILNLTLLLLLGSSSNAQTPFNAFKVDVRGEGKQAILFFPGFGCTGAVWDSAVDVLSKDYKCYVFTFAGFGNVPPIPEPWLPAIKEQIIQFVKKEKLHKPILVGHSIGGTISYWLAISEPEMFKKVIAVDALPDYGSLMIPDFNGQKIPYDNPNNDRLLKMDTATFDKTLDMQVKYMCLNKEKQSFIADMMKTADRKTYVYGYTDMLNLDLRNDMGKIKIPVTVLAATFPDKNAIEKTYNAQFEKLPSVDIRYADHSAHFVMFDQPDWFMQNLVESLK